MRDDFLEFAIRHYDSMREIEIAYDFAAKAHEGQVRYSGEPYIIHPIAVACIPASLLRIRDWRYPVVALLHDVIEDCPKFDQRQIVHEFGHEILAAVLILTKDPKNKKGYIRQIRRKGGILEWTIKLCDKIHNLRTINHMPPAEACRLVQNARRDFLPLARILVQRLPLREQWRAEDLYDEIERLCREFERSDSL